MAVRIDDKLADYYEHRRETSAIFRAGMRSVVPMSLAGRGLCHFLAPLLMCVLKAAATGLNTQVSLLEIVYIRTRCCIDLSYCTFTPTLRYTVHSSNFNIFYGEYNPLIS